MLRNGYVMLHRSVQNCRWFKNINTYYLYMFLLMNSNYEEGVFQNHNIKRGQLVTSLKHLSDDTGMSIQQVRTALKHLKSTHDITIETTSKFTIITVNNYDNHIASTQFLTNEQQTTNRQLTNKQQQCNNIKNNNKKNKVINNIFFETDFSHSDLLDSKSLFKD